MGGRAGVSVVEGVADTAEDYDLTFFNERRRRISRHYNFSFVGAGTCELHNTKSTGASTTVTAPILNLDTGAGTNKFNMAYEGPGGDIDPWSSTDLGQFGFWPREQYVSCLVGTTFISPPENPTDTQIIGIGLAVVYGSNPPWPIETPTPLSSDQHCVVYARTTDGAWFLYTDNGNEARVDALTGVTALDVTGFRGSRVEIFYVPETSISVSIDGVSGITLTGDDMIIGSEALIGHRAAGCFACSGSDAAGRVRGIFTNLQADIIRDR